jgi:hypothetical protein
LDIPGRRLIINRLRGNIGGLHVIIDRLRGRRRIPSLRDRDLIGQIRPRKPRRGDRDEIRQIEFTTTTLWPLV